MNEDILKFIDDNNIAVLSVIRPESSLHAASLHFSSNTEPLEFYFATSRNSRKAESVVDGQKAKASVVIGFKEEEMITLQMDGDIEIIGDELEVARVKEAHFTKHPSAKRFDGDPKTIWIKFTPVWWRYSAFKASPPVFIES